MWSNEVFSPECRTFLFSCENCAALIDYFGEAHSGKEEPRICRQCGFINLIDEEMRLTLSLDQNRPVPVDTARVLQRHISELDYVEYKMAELEAIEGKVERADPGNIMPPKSWIRTKKAKRTRNESSSAEESQQKRRKMDEGSTALHVCLLDKN